MKILAEHLSKENALSGIDARIKLVMALALLVMVLAHKGFLFPLTVFTVSLAVSIALGIQARAFVLRFSEPLFIAGMLIAIKLFFSGHETLFTMNFGGLSITGHRDGLAEGLLLASRILGAVSVVALLGFVTPFTELMAALSWFRAPKGFVEILIFAYRYLFMIFEDANVIYNAQKNRLGYSSVRRGLKSFGVLAGSLTLKAFEHSQSTTLAMVQRGYDGNIPVRKHKPFKPAQVMASGLIIAVMGLLWKI